MPERMRWEVVYDGTEFAGWQVQPGHRTVQGELGRVLARLGEQALPTAAGRTDAGVHALGNVVHADLERSWEAGELERGLASLAPPDITVKGVRWAGDEFHARFGATSRTYHYALGRESDPFLRHRRWAPRRLPDAAWAAEVLASLEGEQECASLAKTGTEVKTTRCRILRAEWRPCPEGAVMTVTADRFLYGMVRALVGILVRGSERGEDTRVLERVLAARDRAAAGEAAPPQGLYLGGVTYEGEPPPPDRASRAAFLAGLEGDTAP
jgi:tRNA pseudouridine38-40 synthase